MGYQEAFNEYYGCEEGYGEGYGDEEDNWGYDLNETIRMDLIFTLN